MKKIIITLFLGFVLIGLTSCTKSLDKYASQMKNSTTSVVSAVVTTSVEDQGTLVYRQEKAITYLEGNNATCTTRTSQLNSSFVLATKEETQTKDVARSELISCKLDESLFISYEIADDKIVCEVEGENIAKVLGSEEFVASSNGTITFTFEKNKIVKITCEFKTESNKDVLISSEYNY